MLSCACSSLLNGSVSSALLLDHINVGSLEYQLDLNVLLSISLTKYSPVLNTTGLYIFKPLTAKDSFLLSLFSPLSAGEQAYFALNTNSKSLLIFFVSNIIEYDFTLSSCAVNFFTRLLL